MNSFDSDETSPADNRGKSDLPRNKDDQTAPRARRNPEDDRGDDRPRRSSRDRDDDRGDDRSRRSSRGREDERDDDRPRRSNRDRDDDREDDRTRRSRRDRDDGYDDDRRGRRSSGSGPKKLWYQQPWAWIAGGVLVLIIIVSASQRGGGSGGGGGNSERNTISVTPAALLSEYQTNEVAADEKYKGKWLKINGNVDTIGKDIADQIYVTFKSGGKFEIISVQCYFDDKHKKKAASLKPGQTLTVTGKCDGKILNVLVKDCEFVD